MLARKSFSLLMGVMLIACDSAAQQEKEIEEKFGVFTGTDELRVRVDENFASATGVWTIEGDDKIADPINISKIWCDRNENYCEDNRSYITSGVGRPVLMAQSEIYTITSWTADKVVAELANPDCRTIQLEISEREKSVTTVTRQQGKCDGSTPNLEKPRLGILITGKQLDKQRGL